MLKIALDLDNTILRTPEILINLHNKLNKNNKIDYNEDMILDWKLRPLIKTDEELAELFKLFDDYRFYDEALVYDNAIQVINQLSMQNYVCIISKHMDSRKPLSFKWIRETFPTVDIVFVNDFKDKGIKLKNFDIVLDDRTDALESCKKTVKHCICYENYLWNSDWTGLRVNNWLELKHFVDNLAKVDKQ